MKKLNITIILLLALALIFTGCRGEGGEDSTALSTVTDSPTETTAEETTSEPETTECTHPDMVTLEVIPNCTENYYIESHCTICDHTERDLMPPYGHRFADGICEICGIKEVPATSEGLEFKKFDTYAVLVGIGTCKDTDVVIPATVDGLPVTEIGAGAFYDQQQIKSITVPENLQKIGNGAFSNCKSIESIILHDGITFIGEDAFDYCVSLKSIDLPKSLIRLRAGVLAFCKSIEEIVIPESVTEIAAGAFLGCDNLKKVIIPASVKKICNLAFSQSQKLQSIDYTGTTSEWIAIEKEQGWCYECGIISVHCSNGEIAPDSSNGLEFKKFDTYAVLVGIGTCTDKDVVIAPTFGGVPVITVAPSAFYNCSSIESVVIPEGVTVIGNEAFYLCRNLKKVTFPSTLDIIGSWAFANCESLEKVALPDGIMMIESRAFSDCVKLSSLTLGKDLEQIQENAFMNCISLRSVTIPSKVVYFGNSAFAGCSALESATLTKGIGMIGDSVFSGCSKLTAIKFTGRTADWEKLDPSPNWMKGSSSSALSALTATRA